MMRVVVLGGGLMGVATAWYLAADGHEVTVIDREVGLAEGTSFANAGLVTPSDSGPWNAPGTLGLLVKYLGREDSPLLVRPAAVPGMAAWGLRFLWNSRAALYRRNTEANTHLALYNLALLQRLRTELGLAYDANTNGTLRVFANAASADEAGHHAEALKGFGVPCEILDPKSVLAREPALSGAGNIAGGIYFAADESGDAHLFTRALGQHAATRGVTFRFGETVTGLVHEGHRITAVRTDRGTIAADAAVMALGCWTPALARTVGARLPIYPVKGYSATVAIDGWNGAPRLPVLHDGLKVATTPLGARLRIGGTAEFAGYDRVLNPARAAAVLNAALRLYPSLAPYAGAERVRQWTGLRPMTPDGRPLIGPLRFRNLIVNAGHGGLGWTLACGSGKLAADLVAGRAPEIDPAPYSLGH
jgi:D-amino-acid dehydrogenase